VVPRNANEAMVASTVGSGGVCVWREAEVRRSFMIVGAFGRNRFRHHKDFFRI
jgi:hypothetical protein